MEFRDEQDTMGTVRVPLAAYYGPQTQRARDNFPLSGMPMPPELIRALARIKYHAALTNLELSLLAREPAEAIAAAAREIAAGGLEDQFVVDVFQTGSGTSTNMNLNEVVAARANEILTGAKAGKHPVHPNDHVNLGQSSNDVIPTAIHIAAASGIRQGLIPALAALAAALAQKGAEFGAVKKIGRTHLQDAVPLSLGDEFSGYARQVELGIDRLEAALPRLQELALGGTAVGTGLNTHPEFASRTIARLAETLGIPFTEARNHFEAQGAQDAAVETSGALKTLAVSLVKIANDLRWLSSGPRCGIGEIQLPSLQPGSSIMPGKVNPVIPEAVIQAAYQVMGNDTAITLAGQAGNFELIVTLPLIARNLLESIRLMTRSAEVFRTRCIEGIRADRQRCASYIEASLALVTPLVPHIGYDRAADLAKQAYETGRTVREVARDAKVMDEKTLDRLLG